MEEQVATAPAAELAGTERESYAFIMNVWQLAEVETYTLAPGHVLRRATTDETEVIKRTLARIAGESNPLADYFWEHRWPHPGGAIERLPEAEWRYFVIAFKGSNVTLHRLQAAMDLAPLELEVGFTVLRWGKASPHNAISWTPGRLFHVLEDAQGNAAFFKRVTVADLDTITEIHTRLAADGEHLVKVGRLVQQISDLKALRHESPLRFLGYFTILESLLTHSPKPTDPYESLARQVKKKVALLNHRWANPLDYAPFGKTSPDMIWTKMYLYRSMLAHGAEPSFTSDLQVLGNHACALRLIKETVKLTIRQALEEPQLLVDLREC